MCSYVCMHESTHGTCVCASMNPHVAHVCACVNPQMAHMCVHVPTYGVCVYLHACIMYPLTQLSTRCWWNMLSNVPSWLLHGPHMSHFLHSSLFVPFGLPPPYEFPEQHFWKGAMASRGEPVEVWRVMFQMGIPDKYHVFIILAESDPLERVVICGCWSVITIYTPIEKQALRMLSKQKTLIKGDIFFATKLSLINIKGIFSRFLWK